MSDQSTTTRGILYEEKDKTQLSPCRRCCSERFNGFTYYHINFHNHLTEGGFVGLARLLGKYALDIPPALSMVLDIPVLLVALFIKGRKFIINTVVAASMFTLFYALIERYSTLVIDLNHNLLAAAPLSGLLTGFGAGIVLRFGGATGGDDVIPCCSASGAGLR